jgi:heme-degrading monooxygenase HmoA
MRMHYDHVYRLQKVYKNTEETKRWRNSDNKRKQERAMRERATMIHRGIIGKQRGMRGGFYARYPRSQIQLQRRRVQ